MEELLDRAGLSGLRHSASSNLGLNKIANTRALQYTKLGSGIAKAAVIGSHSIDPIISAAVLGTNLGTRVFGSNRSTSKMLKDAKTRQIISNQKDYGNKGWDNAAAGSNTATNMSKLMMNQYALASIGGPSLLSADAARVMMGLSPTSAGIGLSTSLGGIGGIGSAMGLHGGMAAMGGTGALMAASIAGNKVSKFINNKSSTSGIRPGLLRTHRTRYSDLTDDSGTLVLQNSLSRLQSIGSISAGESLTISSLIMIYGAVSASAAVAADIRDQGSLKNKEGAGKGHSAVHKLFGDKGERNNFDQINNEERDKSGSEKFFQTLETTSARIVNAYDPMTQMSNLLSGQSSTALSNEVRDRFSPLLLNSEREYGKNTGLSTVTVQTLHLSASQALGNSQTYEDKVIRLLGWIGELNKHSGKELTAIRAEGIGIGISKFGDNGHFSLSRLKQAKEDEELEKNTVYDRYFKKVDETLGYIPGYNMISESAKLASGAMRTTQDFFEKKDVLDRDGNSTGEQKSSFDETEFNPLVRIKNNIMDTIGVDSFLNDDDIKSEIGATELSSQDKMSAYLGNDYPDRFELALSYLHSIKSATEATAEKTTGGYKKTKFKSLSTNKFTGRLGDNTYHNEVNNNIYNKLVKQYDKIGKNSNIVSSIYKLFRDPEDLKKEVFDKQTKGSNFISNVLDGTLDGVTKNNYNNTTYTTSVQDIQDEEENEETRTRTLTVAEKQLIVLEDIRAGVCGDCSGKSGRKLRRTLNRNNRSRDRERDDESSDLLGVSDLPDRESDSRRDRDITRRDRRGSRRSLYRRFTIGLARLKRAWRTDKWGLLKNGAKALVGFLVTMAPRLLFNPYVVGAIAAGAAGYWLYTKVKEISGFDIDGDSEKKLIENHTSKTSENQINITIDRMTKLYDQNQKAAYKRLSKMSTADLNALKIQIDKNWIDGKELLPTIVKILKLRKDFTGGKFNEDDIFEAKWSTLLMTNNYKEFDTNGLNKMREASLDSLMQLQKKHGDQMSKQINNQLQAAINYKQNTLKYLADHKDLSEKETQEFLSERRGKNQNAKMDAEYSRVVERQKIYEKNRNEDNKILSQKEIKKKKIEEKKIEKIEEKKVNEAILKIVDDGKVSNKEFSDTMIMLHNSKMKDDEVRNDFTELLRSMHANVKENTDSQKQIVNMLAKMDKNKTLSNELINKIETKFKVSQ